MIFPFSEMDVFSSRRTFWNRIIMHIWCRTVDEMIDAAIYLGKLPRSLQNLILYVMLEIYHSIHIQGNCSFQDFASGDQLNISDDIAWFRVMGLQFFNIISKTKKFQKHNFLRAPAIPSPTFISDPFNIQSLHISHFFLMAHPAVVLSRLCLLVYTLPTRGSSSPFWGPFIRRQHDLFILYIMAMECVSGAWIRMSSRVLPQRLAAVDGHNEEKHGLQKALSRRILDGKWRHIEAWGILTLAAGLLITLLLHASVERHDTLLRTECLMKPSSHYSAHHSSMYYS